LEEAEAKQKKAEEEAAASARRQAEKELEEEGKKRLSLEDSLKKTKTNQCDLLTEAENKLKKALKTGNVTDIAQTLLETAQLKHAFMYHSQSKQCFIKVSLIKELCRSS